MAASLGETAVLWLRNAIVGQSLPQQSRLLRCSARGDGLRARYRGDQRCDFRFDAAAGENALEIVRQMREMGTGLRGTTIPDIVQLIHWGTSWWFLDPVSKDWPGRTSDCIRKR